MTLHDPCPVCGQPLDGQYKVAGFGPDGSCVYVHGPKVNGGKCWDAKNKYIGLCVTIIGDEILRPLEASTT